MLFIYFLFKKISLIWSGNFFSHASIISSGHVVFYIIPLASPLLSIISNSYTSLYHIYLIHLFLYNTVLLFLTQTYPTHISQWSQLCINLTFLIALPYPYSIPYINLSIGARTTLFYLCLESLIFLREILNYSLDEITRISQSLMVAYHFELDLQKLGFKSPSNWTLRISCMTYFK